MATGNEKDVARAAARFAWPLAFVAVAGMGFVLVRDHAASQARASVVEVVGSNTVVRGLHDLARLETTAVHVEKVIDVADHQKRLYGLVEADDTLLFVASGEVVVGVDLTRLRDEDVRFDEATRTTTVVLPEPEVFTTRFDEMHSYVHSRRTDTLAKRNEQLEALARREATAAFAEAGRSAEVSTRAKEQAERQLRALARAWGAGDLVIRWRSLAPAEGAPSARP